MPESQGEEETSEPSPKLTALWIDARQGSFRLYSSLFSSCRCSSNKKKKETRKKKKQRDFIQKKRFSTLGVIKKKKRGAYSFPLKCFKSSIT